MISNSSLKTFSSRFFEVPVFNLNRFKLGDCCSVPSYESYLDHLQNECGLIVRVTDIGSITENKRALLLGFHVI